MGIYPYRIGLDHRATRQGSSRPNPFGTLHLRFLKFILQLVKCRNIAPGRKGGASERSIRLAHATRLREVDISREIGTHVGLNTPLL